MTEDHPQEYAYLRLPPYEEVRSCVGLVLAGMAARARVGVGGLEEAVEVLEGFHADDAPTRFRFSLAGDGVLAEVCNILFDGRSLIEVDGLCILIGLDANDRFWQSIDTSNINDLGEDKAAERNKGNNN